MDPRTELSSLAQQLEDARTLHAQTKAAYENLKTATDLLKSQYVLESWKTSGSNDKEREAAMRIRFESEDKALQELAQAYFATEVALKIARDRAINFRLIHFGSRENDWEL